MSQQCLIYRLPIELWEYIFDFLCYYPLVPNAERMDVLADLALFVTRRRVISKLMPLSGARSPRPLMG